MIIEEKKRTFTTNDKKIYTVSLSTRGFIYFIL